VVFCFEGGVYIYCVVIILIIVCIYFVPPICVWYYKLDLCRMVTIAILWSDTVFSRSQYKYTDWEGS